MRCPVWDSWTSAEQDRSSVDIILVGALWPSIRRYTHGALLYAQLVLGHHVKIHPFLVSRVCQNLTLARPLLTCHILRWVMTCNIVSWIFLGIASLNILDYYLFSSCRGPRIKGVKRGDRHAALRTGIRPFRGILWLPFMGRYLLKLQQVIMESDPSGAMRRVPKWNLSPEVEDRLITKGDMMGDCTEDCIKKQTERGCPDHPPSKLPRKGKRRRLGHSLGQMSGYPHFPEGGGLVGKPRSKCGPCNNGRNCPHASHTFWRGFPWHRSSWTDSKAKSVLIECFLDIRRLSCIICAFLLSIVQFGSFISELASKNARWQYRSQMEGQMADWVSKALGAGHWWNDFKTPLLLSECSHFHWSSVPVTFISVKSHDATVRYRYGIPRLQREYHLRRFSFSTAVAGLNRIFLSKSKA